MEMVEEMILAGLFSVGIAILFQNPKRASLFGGLIGGLSWGVLYLGENVAGNIIAASFLGAFTVGILGEIFARYTKKPATLYVNPGIVPLVPGAGMYYTMFYLVENNYAAAIDKGAETFFIAAAISMGLIISSAFSESIKRVKSKI